MNLVMESNLNTKYNAETVGRLLDGKSSLSDRIDIARNITVPAFRERLAVEAKAVTLYDKKNNNE